MDAVSQNLSVTLKAKLFRGFADPSRLAVLETLRPGEKTVSEIVATTGLSQPSVSGHLACLNDCGLVTSRRIGRSVAYAFSDPRLVEVLCTVEDILAGVAERIYSCTRYRHTDAPDN